MQPHPHQDETPTQAALPSPEHPEERVVAYEPPAIVYRAPLEVTAAFCDPYAGGKTPVESCMTVINS
ncbi:MAG: hypothetical protein WAU00_01290 [Caldilinea sp.]|nr:hypothetical protein [Anaerolineales bacterium]